MKPEFLSIYLVWFFAFIIIRYFVLWYFKLSKIVLILEKIENKIDKK